NQAVSGFPKRRDAEALFAGTCKRHFLRRPSIDKDIDKIYACTGSRNALDFRKLAERAGIDHFDEDGQWVSKLTRTGQSAMMRLRSSAPRRSLQSPIMIPPISPLSAKLSSRSAGYKSAMSRSFRQPASSFARSRRRERRS
ncbi:MAG TPA: hypothetical protein VJM09_16190, partial [Sphingobium sp.]|nr:hypothetical protein [Sphingobium sp.]